MPVDQGLPDGVSRLLERRSGDLQRATEMRKQDRSVYLNFVGLRRELGLRDRTVHHDAKFIALAEGLAIRRYRDVLFRHAALYAALNAADDTLDHSSRDAANDALLPLRRL